MDKVFETESLETFKDVTQDILNNLYSSELSPTLGFEAPIKQAAKEDIKKLITNCNFDLNRISESLQSKGWMEDKVACFVALLEEKKAEILYAALLAHNSQYGESLTDFDWLLKIVMGTNDLKTLSYPLLQLVLSTVNSSGAQNKTVYDINKEMLGKLIKLLENIDNVQYSVFFLPTSNFLVNLSS